MNNPTARWALAVVAFGSALALPAVGQARDNHLGVAEPRTRLVNVDTGYVPKFGEYRIALRANFMVGHEDAFYGDVELLTGLSQGLAILARTSVADYHDFRRTGFVIEHGGSDIELMARYQVPMVQGLTVDAGVAFPHTPAQDEAFFTAAAVYQVPSKVGDVYLGAKGVFREDSEIYALTAGAAIPAGKHLEVVGDVTVPIRGRNTLSTTTARGAEGALVGLGVRYAPNYRGLPLVYEFGLTNAVGRTTGFSLTPSLGESYGFYFGVGVKF